MSFSLAQFREDFPILKQEVNGYPLTYLDSTNTSLTPESVLEAMDAYYQQYNANVHRAVYHLSEQATAAMDSAREKIRSFVNAGSVEEIIFTRNATESFNLVVQTWGREHLSQGDVVVLSIMEHHSNIVPWQILQKEKGFDIVFIELSSDGRLDMNQLQEVLQTGKVKMVSLIHQSNVLGTVTDVKKISELAHQHHSLVMIDGAQAVPHMSVDVQDLGVDFYVFTGHKMCGPTGIGVLYGKKDLLKDMPVYMGGGDMIRTVSKEGSTWNDLPYKFEAGTPNIAGAIGLGAAVDYLDALGMEKIHEIEQDLLRYALSQLPKIDGLNVFGPLSDQQRGATISFELEGVHPHDLATILADRGVCVRAGHHCAQPLMEYLHVPATTRASLYFYNTQEDVDCLIEGIHSAQEIFKLK